MNSIYRILIEPFREKEYLIGCILWFIAIVIVIIFSAFSMIILNEIFWANTLSEIIDGILISTEYKSSTEKSNLVNTVGYNGHPGIGVVVTGDPEKYITVWETQYGRIVCNSKDVFRFAKPRVNLIVKIRNEIDKIRIIGIEK